MTSQSKIQTVLFCFLFIVLISMDASAGGDCDSPAVMAQYSRKIAITPAGAPDPVAILITGDSSNTEVSCVSKYVQADGTLGDTAVYQLPSTWGTVYARGIEIRPLATYDVTVLCPAGQSTPVMVTMSRFPEMTGNASINLDDLLCALNAYYAGAEFSCGVVGDITGPGCVPDNINTLDEMLYVVRGELGETSFPSSCPDACPQPCTLDVDCSDDLYCTGTETCVNNVCQPGVSPCTNPTPVCDENTDSCSASTARIFAVPLNTNPALSVPGQDFAAIVDSYPVEYRITVALYVDVEPDQLATGVEVALPGSAPCSGGGSIYYVHDPENSPLVDTTRSDYVDITNQFLPIVDPGIYTDPDPLFGMPRIAIVRSHFFPGPIVAGRKYIGQVEYLASADCIGTAVIDIAGEPLSGVRNQSYAALPLSTDGLAINVQVGQCCGPPGVCMGQTTSSLCILRGGQWIGGLFSCNDNFCQPASNCTTNSQCQDNNPCTSNVCDNGFCLFPRNYPLNKCCDPETGALSNAACNDGNACTQDICWGDVCVHQPTSGIGTCCNPATGQIVSCPTYNHDDDACTIRQCVPSTGECILTDIRATPCTSDAECLAVSSSTCGNVNPGFCDCICGNGIKEGQEICDSGGDWWNCDSDCTFPSCGDGHVNEVRGEECDDQNGCSCDSCNSCSLETEVCGPCPCTTHADCSLCADDNACNLAYCDFSCGFCFFYCTPYGKFNGRGGLPDLDDILCSLSGFANFANCTHADIAPCGGNATIDLDDILAVLAAFGGSNPCGCDENSAPGSGVSPLCGSTSP